MQIFLFTSCELKIHQFIFIKNSFYTQGKEKRKRYAQIRTYLAFAQTELRHNANN
jgi:hypothetical protein